VRRHFARAGDANPVQLKYWTRAWPERIRDLYAAHDELMAAWQDAAAPVAPEQTAAAARPEEEAYAAWGRCDRRDRRGREGTGETPGLAEPAKKALATLDREWDGLIAHRDYPLVSLDSNAAERMIRRRFVTRKNARGSHKGTPPGKPLSSGPSPPPPRWSASTS
jgi:transposase